MKKTYLLVLLTLATYCSRGQKEMDFKFGYLPNFNYTLTQEQISENNITYITSDEIVESPKITELKIQPSFKDTSDRFGG